MKINTNKGAIKETLDSRYVEKIWPSKKQLEDFLTSGRRLTIYIGIDPTGPQLHLGHSTNFLFLKKLQKLGHKVILLIGDFTAQIGDPTGKMSMRKPMTKSEILFNCKNYKIQAGKILDLGLSKNHVSLEFNSRWLSKLNLGKLIDITSKVTVGKIIKRDMFQERIREGREIYLHEFLYPLLQGYDSVALNTDAEIGGNDQTFNMLVGRDLVKIYQKREKIVITTKLLINPKTKKKMMSKSEGGYISLDDKPHDMYGKVMALPDEVIVTCFELCTEISQKELESIKKSLRERKIHPRQVKVRLAKEIVGMYHGDKEAKAAEEEFNKVFRERKSPSKLPIFVVPHDSYPLIDLLTELKFSKSKSEAKRLILQGGVTIRFQGKESKSRDWSRNVEIKDDLTLKIGKRRFARIKRR
ncbi:MAG: tyrosine--tRNA ligase [Patescibacteria group bacterium]